jgi:hypothetical protein
LYNTFRTMSWFPYIQIGRRFRGDAPGTPAQVVARLSQIDDQRALRSLPVYMRSYNNWLFRYGTWVAQQHLGTSGGTITLRQRRFVRGADAEVSLQLRARPNGRTGVIGQVRVLTFNWISLALTPLAFWVLSVLGNSVTHPIVLYGAGMGMPCVLSYRYVRNREDLLRAVLSRGGLQVIDD